MSPPHLIAIAALAASVAACETTPSGGYGSGYAPRPASTAFRADDFAWSAREGRAAIDGRIDYRREGQAFNCTGSVALTPDTPYTRARFQTLYGSTDRAAIPVAVVRARTVPDPNADYRSFVRDVRCENNRFEFSNLPAGGWFVIVPVSAGGEPLVLMRHVTTRSGRVSLTL